MAKCIGCSKLKGSRHAAVCEQRPGGKTVREADCVVPNGVKETLNVISLAATIHSEGMTAMQEKVIDLLSPVMLEAERRRGEAGIGDIDLWKDIERVHTSDETEYVEAVLERCAAWLKDDMPKTLEGIELWRGRN